MKRLHHTWIIDNYILIVTAVLQLHSDYTIIFLLLVTEVTRRDSDVPDNIFKLFFNQTFHNKSLKGAVVIRISVYIQVKTVSVNCTHLYHQCKECWDKYWQDNVISYFIYVQEVVMYCIYSLLRFMFISDSEI